MKFETLTLSFNNKNERDQFITKLTDQSEKLDLSLTNTGDTTVEVTVPEKNMIKFFKVKNSVYRLTIGSSIDSAPAKLVSKYSINRDNTVVSF